jgi:hypothetical protein
MLCLGFVALSGTWTPAVGQDEDPESAAPTGEIRGRVYQEAVTDPLRGAVVYIVDTEWTAVTDSLGRFGFLKVPEGFYVVSLYHPRMAELGLVEPPEGLVVVAEDQVSPIDFQIGSAAELGFGSENNPFVLEPLTVVSIRPSRSRATREGARIDVVDRAEIEELETSARDVGDLIREIPSLRVRRVGGILCVETRRLTTRRGGGLCTGQVPVFLDDARISDPANFLATLRPYSIQRIEFLPGVAAGVRYGTGSQNGILLIYTR